MISVIVPLYNVEKYIIKCLESIVNQSYKDFELIIVDDGSKDKSVEVSKKYLEDKNIIYHIFEKDNGGQSSSRNFGVTKANGEYICFIDSDDVVTVDFLERLHKGVIENDVDFSFCNFKFVKQQSIEIDNNDEQFLYERKDLLNMFLKRKKIFLVVSMLFKKDFLISNQITFDESINYSEDQMYIWDVLFSCERAVYLDAKMYGYYVREKSIMTSSGFERIKNAHERYKEFVVNLKNKYPDNKKTIDIILPRWQLGTLYTAANILSRNEFDSLYNLMDGKTILKRIMGINEIKAILLAGVSSVSSGFLYRFCKRLNLNE